VRIYTNIEFQIEQLIALIARLSEDDYNAQHGLSSSIGAHVRHMVEFLQILVGADKDQVIDYASRKRDKLIESDKAYATAMLQHLKVHMRKEEDFTLYVSEEGDRFTSSYLRELLYQHEHMVHHCAIVRLMLASHPEVELDPSFGFARSTMAHKHKENQADNVSA